MRAVIVITGVLAGSGLGLASSLDDGWGVRLVMIMLGAGVAAPIAAALSGLASGMATKTQRLDDDDSPHGTNAESLTANFWRDRGHAPFMRPPGGAPDQHQFDPNRQN